MGDVKVGDTVETRYGLGIVTQVSAGGVQVHLRAANAFITVRALDIRKQTGQVPAGRAKLVPAASHRAPPTGPIGPSPAESQSTRPPEIPDGTSLAPAATTPTPDSAFNPATLNARARMMRAPSTSRPFRPPEHVQLRQAVEALRFGLVPTARLERLTLGYAKLESWILDLLPDARAGQPVAAEICGPFGTGKSHACAVVRHVAREMNYLVANVEVDGQRVTLANPSVLLNALTSTLHAQDLVSSTPIVELYLRAISASKEPLRTMRTWDDKARVNYEFVRFAHARGALPSIGHIVEKVLSCSPNFTISQAKYEIVLDRVLYPVDVTLRPPLGRTLVERPGGFVQSLVAIADAAKKAGYGGLVITIDEFEVERNLQAKDRERMASLIRELADFIAGRTDHERAPLAIFFASVGQDGHAGDEIISHLIRHGGGERHVLEPLSITDRSELAREAYKLYADVYDLNEELDKRHIIETEQSLAESGIVDDSGVTRAFIKEFVATLDRNFGPPAIRDAA